MKDIFSSLESKFGYQFNYLEETVSGIEIVPPATQLDFEQAINYLRSASGLIYHILSNNFISVQKEHGLLLCGYLKDKDSQDPLVFASIQGVKKSTVSDENGYFELEVTTENDPIVIRYLGYRPLYRNYKFFKTDACHPIYLVAEAQTLSAVVLSNYLIEGIDKYSSGAFEIDFSKFKILPGLIETDVLQTVQAFPGIQSINETVSNINIRGGTHDQNLILWDDIKMYQSGHFFGLISAFNPHITQKVSLQKNGTASSYTDGVSGTIAMKSKESVNPKLNGKLGINLVNANAFVDVPLGQRSSVQIAGRKSLSDFWKTPTYDEYFDRIAQDTEVAANESSVINSDKTFDFYDASLRWLYRASDNDHLRLNLLYVNNELLFNENAIIDGDQASRESSLTQNSFAAGFSYRRNWSDRFITDLDVYNTEYKLEAINANLLQSQRFLQENSVSETGARLQGQYTLSELFTAHLGYQFVETEITNLDDVDVPIFRSLVTEVVRTHSPFAQLDYRSKDRQTYINLGFRHNYMDKYQKHLYEPRVTLTHKFLENFSVEVLGEMKHQITSQVINFQNDFLGVEKRRWQLSNDDDIPIIESEQISVGLSYSNDGWLVNAEGFYKQVDGITTQSQGFQNQYEFVKSNGSYEVSGIDFLLRKNFRNTNIWVSYSFMDNEYTFRDLPENRFPSNLDITHSATFGITYSYKNFNIASDVNWHTGKPTTLPVLGAEVLDDAVNYGITNNDRLDDYVRVDASATYEFALGKAKTQLGVSVWNVLDQQNEINNYFRVGELGGAQEFVQNSLGLTPNAVLRVLF